MTQYPGGKNSGGAYQRIICQMPPHDVYLECFLGSAAVMKAKLPARLNIGLDVNENAWREVRKYFDQQPGNFHILNKSALSFLEDYIWLSANRYFVYLDPPYLLHSRKQKGSHLYTYEFFLEDHERLLKLAKSIPAMVAISGYHSELYARELKDWRSINWQQVTRGGKMATEFLWMNYAQPLELHDYRYLGDGFRERERIKKKKNRWRAKLERMPTLERQALLATLAEMQASTTSPEIERLQI
jgi:DNA adenine methylase